MSRKGGRRVNIHNRPDAEQARASAVTAHRILQIIDETERLIAR
jgi:hypothetical protein